MARFSVSGAKMTVINADCLAGLREHPDNVFDSIVTDPPYELGFMGKTWDATGIANNVELWRECLRVLKPGGHLLAFSGSRTYHRMACAIEDAGFEVRDQIMWVYGSGFPKSLDVSKALDKAAGAERETIGSAFRAATGRAEQGSGGYSFGESYSVTAPATPEAQQWRGWGTALKPAHEPICVARKPLAGTVATNVLQFGTGALNIDGCRVPGEYETRARDTDGGASMFGLGAGGGAFVPAEGRWPANLIHDGSDEVLDAFGQFGEKGAAAPVHRRGSDKFCATYGKFAGNVDVAGSTFHADTGTAARFFYCAKASKADRGADNVHPTVKPTELMRYLVRLVTPPGGIVLDPFAGSGSTGKACALEGFLFLGYELDPTYAEIANARIKVA